MSQNISIKEGELSRQFGHINKLKVPQSGGGDTLWVPEDEVQTDTLYVDKNGVYDAHAGTFTEARTTTKKTKKGKKKKTTTYITTYDEELECYGWSEVSVNIIDSVTGKDSNGGVHKISVGDNDYLTDEELPTQIVIVVPPDKMSYTLFEPIDVTGMVVKAYYADGREWGEVPRWEYKTDPTIATEGTGGGKVSDLPTTLPQPIPVDDWDFPVNTYRRSGDGNPFTLYAQSSDDKLVGNLIYSPNHDQVWIASPNKQASVRTHYEWDYEGRHVTEDTWAVCDTGFTYNGKTVYYNSNVLNNSPCHYAIHATPEYPVPYIEMDDRYTANPNDAWTMIYGMTVRAKTTITVKWNRPEDGEELTTSFDIEVNNPD